MTDSLTDLSKFLNYLLDRGNVLVYDVETRRLWRFLSVLKKRFEIVLKGNENSKKRKTQERTNQIF